MSYFKAEMHQTYKVTK